MESTTTYGTVSLGDGETQRYEHEGCVLECEDLSDGWKQTMTDINSVDFTKIEFYRARGRDDMYVVSHDNLTGEKLYYTGERTKAQIGLSTVFTTDNGMVFTTVVDGRDHRIAIEDDNVTTKKE